jgi:hypothetical protein
LSQCAWQLECIVIQNLLRELMVMAWKTRRNRFRSSYVQKMYPTVQVSFNSLIWSWRGLKIYEDIPSGNSAASFQNFLIWTVLSCLSIQSLPFPTNPQAAWWLLNKVHSDQAEPADYSFNNWPNGQSDWTTCSWMCDHICFEPRYHWL